MFYTHHDWAGPAQRGRRDSSRHSCPNHPWCPEQKQDYLQSSPHPGGSASQLKKEETITDTSNKIRWEKNGR